LTNCLFTTIGLTTSNPVFVEQAFDFVPDGSQGTMLDLDQLAVTHDIDPVVVEPLFDARALVGVDLLELAMERRFHDA